ncbi:DUF6894 family protein [Flavisphingomonas formosensis]|uniref:DUF6894 family protein n=1 Tax=Flavisphingomonas formosensis TaxID=861534 RepID=UPI0012FA7F77|nr:hypothetical protein [Sphingomonas formosensis]
MNMQRYYFHVVNGSGSELDTHGMMVRDKQDGLDHARTLACPLLTDELLSGRSHATVTILVEDTESRCIDAIKAELRVTTTKHRAATD